MEEDGGASGIECVAPQGGGPRFVLREGKMQPASGPNDEVMKTAIVRALG